MPKVKLSFPIDSTFLSSVIYEGLLYLIPEYSKSFSLTEIDFEDDFLSKAFASLEDERIKEVEVRMRGKYDPEIFKKFRLELPNEKTFYNLLKSLKENFNIIKVSREIEIFKYFSKGAVFIGLKKESKRKKLKKESKKEEDEEDIITPPQIFKIDRYTGFSSLESALTSDQLTLYLSKEVALIALLGIYSSFVVSVRQQQQNNYYFLFFSPDETLKRLSEGKKDLIKTLMEIKNTARNALNKIISKHYSNELLLTEVALNVEVQNLLKKEKLDKISLSLFRISPEGQTYKIYEVVPLDFFKETRFEAFSKYFRDQEKLIGSLRKILLPEGILLEALSSMNKKNRYSEAENILVAINGLYRFVVLGDVEGFYEFTRKIGEAIRKLENSDDPRERWRAGEYRRILTRFS
ncbi:MAG: hypothetical protein ACK401_08080 [Archaeoglobaceae archaeon]